MEVHYMTTSNQWTRTVCVIKNQNSSKESTLESSDSEFELMETCSTLPLYMAEKSNGSELLIFFLRFFSKALIVWGWRNCEDCTELWVPSAWAGWTKQLFSGFASLNSLSFLFALAEIFKSFVLSLIVRCNSLARWKLFKNKNF